MKDEQIIINNKSSKKKRSSWLIVKSKRKVGLQNWQKRNFRWLKISMKINERNYSELEGQSGRKRRMGRVAYPETRCSRPLSIWTVAKQTPSVSHVWSIGHVSQWHNKPVKRREIRKLENSKNFRTIITFIPRTGWIMWIKKVKTRMTKRAMMWENMDELVLVKMWTN